MSDNTQQEGAKAPQKTKKQAPKEKYYKFNRTSLVKGKTYYRGVIYPQSSFVCQVPQRNGKLDTSPVPQEYLEDMMKSYIFVRDESQNYIVGSAKFGGQLPITTDEDGDEVYALTKVRVPRLVESTKKEYEEQQKQRIEAEQSRKGNKPNKVKKNKVK